MRLIVIMIAALASGVRPLWLILQVHKRLGVEDFMYLGLYIPAVILGMIDWPRQRNLLQQLPVTLCALLVLAGLWWVDPAERNRGLLVAGGTLIALPIGVLVRDDRLRLVFMRTFVVSVLISTSLLVVLTLPLPGRARGLTFMEARDGRGNVITNRNQIGAQTGLATIVAVMLAATPPVATRRRRRRNGMSWAAFAGGLAVETLISASRGAILSLVGGIGWLSSRHARYRMMAILMLIFAGIVLMMAELVAPTLGLFGTSASRFERGDLSSLGGRASIWSAGWDVMTASDVVFLRGVGSGGVDRALGARIVALTPGAGAMLFRRSSHNTFVEWGMSYGVIGTLMGIWLLWTVARRAIRLDRHDRTWQTTTLLVWSLLNSMTLVINRTAFWPFLGALMFAMVFRQVRRPVSQTEKTSAELGVAADGVPVSAQDMGGGG